MNVTLSFPGATAAPTQKVVVTIGGISKQAVVKSVVTKVAKNEGGRALAKGALQRAAENEGGAIAPKLLLKTPSVKLVAGFKPSVAKLTAGKAIAGTGTLMTTTLGGWVPALLVLGVAGVAAGLHLYFSKSGAAPTSAQRLARNL